MRIHTNTLTETDVWTFVRGVNAIGDRSGPPALTGVGGTAVSHGSRTHARALEVQLTGTSPRRPNTGTRGSDSDVYAATWDEWGMMLARLFHRDPAMVVGSVGRPIYLNAEHFHWATGNRFAAPMSYDALTSATQHRNHGWEYVGELVGGRYSVNSCKRGPAPCGALRRFGSDAYVAEMFGAMVGA